MAKSIRRLSEYAPQESVLPELHKLDEILNTEQILTEFEFREGNFGEYVVFKLAHPDTGEEKWYSCGGVAILKQFALIAPENLPLAVKPVKSGRTFIFA